MSSRLASTVVIAIVSLAVGCVPPASQPSYFGPAGTPPPAPGDSPAPESSVAPSDPVAADASAGVVSPPQPASTLTLTAPAGFAQNQGWWMTRREEPGYRYVATTAGIARVMPGVAPSGDAGASLRALWQAYMPAEAKNEAGGLVYRRLIGDGLLAYYLHGSGVQKGEQPSGHWYTLYLVDCGATWEPLIAGGIYQQTAPSAGFEMSVGQGMANGLASVEPLLATARCAGPRGAAIVPPEHVAGHYYYGSGASQAYVGIYTGTTYNYNLSYGGEYDLRADGTLSYRHSSASGFDAAVTFQGEKSGGRWTVSQDLLVLELPDLGRTKRFRIACVTTFPQEKVMILLDERERADPTTVTRGTYLTTQKK